MTSVGHRGLPKSEVPRAFDVGARAYDRLVGANPATTIICASRRAGCGFPTAARVTPARRRVRDRCLDGGTARGRPHAEIVAVDASAGMLAEAAEKSWPDSVRFVHTPIEDLADAGVHGPFDGILAAYLLRNLDDPDTQLRAFREILRPGATLAVHEYSVRDSRLASGIWDAVCWGIIIPSGWRQTVTARSTAICGAA